MSGSVARLLKALIDRTVAVLLLFLLSPVLVILMLLVRFDSKGPAIFRQVRTGLSMRPFTVFKLRTMTVGSEKGSVATSKDDVRLTRIGGWLRDWSLDELPQLWNVLRGEMSLVGPRPLLPGTVREDEARRQDMRPGMTGLAEVSGRKKLSWEERMVIDLDYVDRWSLGLDLWILWRTPFVVLGRDGIYDEEGKSSIRPGSAHDRRDSPRG